MERPSLARIPLHHPQCNLGNFVESARAVPGSSVALIDITGSEIVVFTYDDLEQQVRLAVGACRSLGFARGSRVVLALPNSAAYLVVFLALMRVGAIPVLLNPRLASDSIQFIAGDSAAVGVIADLDDLPGLAILAELPALRHCVATGRHLPASWSSWRALTEQATADDTIETMGFDDQAFQPYTAGSTGIPKGIVLTHGGMLWGIEHSQMYWPRVPTDRGIVAAPMFHKNAMRGNIKPILRGGGSVVVMKNFSPRPFLEAVARQHVTTCGGVPAMFAEILHEDELIRTSDFSALRQISMGSSTVPAELIDRLQQAFPGTAVKESYGLTEGGGPTRAPLDGRPVPSGSVGIAAPEYEVKLVDEQGRENTERGEMHIRSPYILKAYAGLPELTQRRIYDGWLRTGDLFRADADGFYYFLGRNDDMFVCGGENIYPKDVESLILKHPDVADTIVVPLPHQTKGYAPTALVTSRNGCIVDPRSIQDHCAANGPTFAIPRAVLVVDRLPLTTTGKPDRKAASTVLSTRFGILSSRSAQQRAAS